MRFSGFYDLLGSRAQETPDASALRWSDGQNVCTADYGQLFETASGRAEELRGEQKSCLALISDGSIQTVVDLFGAVMAGMQVVMLDASLPEDVLRECIAWGDADFLAGPPDLCAGLNDCLTDGVSGGEGRILFFTSGTTASSKAVVLTDHSLCQSAWNGSQMLPLEREDILMCILPLSHVFGFVCGLLWALQCGASAALGRGPRHYWDDWDLFRPTAASLVPSMADMLSGMNCFNPELRLILIGAGDCRDEALERIVSSGRRVAFGYGLTETSSGVAISVGGDLRALDICPDNRIEIADDGEILIDAPTCIMQGYYKRPEDTEEAMRGGLLHTGDIGSLDGEGKLHLSGRKNDVLVFSSGTKIYLPEYEGELSDILGIKDLAVVKRDDRPVLVCCTDMSEDKIREKLRFWSEKTPRSRQLGGIEIRTEPLPRTATGKLMRWKL